jgi:hypothetical protein
MTASDRISLHYTLRLFTSHGTRTIPASENETVEEVLLRNRIPLSLVSLYSVTDDGSDEKLFMSSRACVADVIESRRIPCARIIRNITLDRLNEEPEGKSDHPVLGSIETLLPNKDSSAGFIRKVQTPQNCLDIVRHEVDVSLRRVIAESPTRAVVIGASGGGDSNALIASMGRSQHREGLRIIPVLILGIPDWDTQRDAAFQVCQSVGLDLSVIRPEQLASMLGLRSIEHGIEAFAAHFPGIDREFFGTWLLRRGLTLVAEREQAKHVFFGANREDLLAETLARLMSGLLPLPSPVRRMGEISFVYPLWRIPKRVADAIHSEPSSDNYAARDSSFTDGRAISLLMAHMMSNIPGADIALLEGCAAIAERSGAHLIDWDPVLSDFAVTDMVTPELREEWLQFLLAAGDGGRDQGI